MTLGVLDKVVKHISVLIQGKLKDSHRTFYKPRNCLAVILIASDNELK